MYDQIIGGLTIFAKYGGKEIGAEHDTLFAEEASEIELSESDEAKLKELGWFVDSDNYWIKFV